MSDKVYTVQDYKSGQPRWCPKCGGIISIHDKECSECQEKMK